MSKVHSESIKHYQHHHRFFFSCIIPNAEPFLSTSTSVSNFAHFKNGLEKYFFGNVTHIFPLVAFAELFFKVGTNE